MKRNKSVDLKSVVKSNMKRQQIQQQVGSEAKMEILACTRLIVAKDNQRRLACSNRVAAY